MEIGSSASKLFGSSSAQDIIAAGASAGATQEQQSAQAIVTAQKREINRIRGYKLQLTPTENFRLTEIQGEILKIQEKTSKGTVRPDELADRSELYKEADRIIGKPVLDFDASKDEVLTGFATALESLMQPKQDPATTKRVALLERIKSNLEKKLEDAPDNASVLAQFESVTRSISQIKPLRLVEQLSASERKIYDETVESMNNYVGVKLQLSSRDAIRVTALERSIENLAGNLPADPASQPTSASVSRALTRFA